MRVPAALRRRVAVHGLEQPAERRLQRHRAGTASRYTASRLPVELALALPMEAPATRAARRRSIKRLDRAAKLDLIAARV
jgi:predicted GIY-YIG superfamily endonuclease